MDEETKAPGEVGCRCELCGERDWADRMGRRQVGTDHMVCHADVRECVHHLAFQVKFLLHGDD